MGAGAGNVMLGAEIAASDSLLGTSARTMPRAGCYESSALLTGYQDRFKPRARSSSLRRRCRFLWRERGNTALAFLYLLASHALLKCFAGLGRVRNPCSGRQAQPLLEIGK